ncbi:glycosyltransferase family 87 protein [Methylobacterium sp. ID0610]|uniref:glycosyltransferase family 87 protein n=1 Tax=Methylobacterium carpenticola TaxID=3344827 RepID=UPI0036CF54F3
MSEGIPRMNGRATANASARAVARAHARPVPLRQGRPLLWAASAILAMIGCGIALRLSGYVGGAYSWFTFTGALDDSWMPMGRAYAHIVAGNPSPLYDLFFVEHVKFQYPPSSLLIYAAYDALGITPSVAALNRLVWFCILAMPVLTALICVRLMTTGPLREIGAIPGALLATAFALAALFFYPIMIAWRLGQVQALLNALFALACLLWLWDRRLLAGACIGLVCLVKPQFSLFLVWALIRRETAFAAGQAVCLGLGLLVSVALFGFSNHLDYLSVLTYISQRGEIFWDNTSVNGLMNGLMFPDEVLKFDYSSFPPPTPLVRIATLWSSVLIVAYALVPRAGARRAAILDFLTAAMAFTLASPIAWGHHYGIAFPVLVILFFAIAADPDAARRRTRLILWGLCLVAIGNYWNISERLAGTVAAPLQSWRLVAVVTVLVLLHRVQAQTARSPGPAPAALDPARA